VAKQRSVDQEIQRENACPGGVCSFPPFIPSGLPVYEIVPVFRVGLPVLLILSGNALIDTPRDVLLIS
jgi:hypothetical protein